MLFGDEEEGGRQREGGRGLRAGEGGRAEGCGESAWAREGGRATEGGRQRAAAVGGRRSRGWLSGRGREAERRAAASLRGRGREAESQREGGRALRAWEGGRAADGCPGSGGRQIGGLRRVCVGREADRRAWRVAGYGAVQDERGRQEAEEEDKEQGALGLRAFGGVACGWLWHRARRKREAGS